MRFACWRRAHLVQRRGGPQANEVAVAVLQHAVRLRVPQQLQRDVVRAPLRTGRRRGGSDGGGSGGEGSGDGVSQVRAAEQVGTFHC
jgi:hypothetical protein